MPSRIPKQDAAFDSSITTATNYLLAPDPIFVTNWQRLNLTPAEITDWQNFNSDWVITYAKYVDLNQRTRSIKDHKNNIKANYTAFANPILGRLANQPFLLTESDREALNLPVRDTQPSPRGLINISPYVNITPLSGSRMKIRTRLDEDATRASMHPLADAIEIRYIIGAAVPATPELCPNMFISKKALFTIEAGIINKGKSIFLFARWVNFTTPANSGPFSTVHTAIILG